MEYIVHLRGGSISSRPVDAKGRRVIKSFASMEEARECAKRLNRQLTPGEKLYYKMWYVATKK